MKLPHHRDLIVLTCPEESKESRPSQLALERERYEEEFSRRVRVGIQKCIQDKSTDMIMSYIKLNNEIVYFDEHFKNVIIEFNRRSHELVDKKVKNTILSLVKVLMNGELQNVATISWGNNLYPETWNHTWAEIAAEEGWTPPKGWNTINTD